MRRLCYGGLSEDRESLQSTKVIPCIKVKSHLNRMSCRGDSAMNVSTNDKLPQSWPCWIRWVIAFVVVVAGGAAWGLIVHMLDISRVFTAIGAIFIALVVISWLFPGKKEG